MKNAVREWYLKFITLLSITSVIVGCGGQPTDDDEVLVLSIYGIEGGGDTVLDEWLTDLSSPTVQVQSSSLATTIEFTIKNAAGSSDVCGPQSSSSPTHTFSSCTLVEGTDYQIHVRYGNDLGEFVEATNSGYAFTVDTVEPTANIDSNPTNPDNQDTATFEFSGNDGGSGLSGFQCQIDGGGYSPCTSPHIVNNLAVANHTFEVRSVDVAGNIGSSVSYNWDVLPAGPQPFLVQGIQGGADTTNNEYLTSGSNAHVFWDAALYAATYNVEIRDDADLVTVCTLENTPGTDYNFSSCNLTEGVSYKAHVTALDSLAVPLAATNSPYGFTVDTIGPTTTITASPSDPSNNPAPMFTFSAVDGTSGVASYECQLDGGGYSSCTSPNNLVGLIDKSYQFDVRAIDNAGNIGAAVSHTWTVDTTGPDPFNISGVQGGLDAVSDNYLNDGNTPHVFWQAAGGASSYDVLIRNAGDTSDVCPLVNTAGTDYDFSACNLIENTAYIVKVSAIDAATNTTAASNNNFSFLVDTIAPTVSFVVAPSDPSNESAPSITFSGADAGSGVASYECQLNGAGYASCSSPHALSGLLEGAQSLDIRAIDNAGNVGAPTSHAWNVDLTAPGDFSVSGIQGGLDTTSDMYLTNGTQPHPYWQSATDAVSYDVTVRNGGDTADVCALVNTAGTDLDLSSCALSEGQSYKLYVVALDNAGNNKVALNAPFDFTVDSTAPTTSFTVTPTNPSVDTAPTFEMNGTDAASGVASYECQLDGGGFIGCTSPHALSGLSIGNHTFEARAIDNAGNVGSAVSYNWDVIAGAYLSISETDAYDFGSVLLGSTTEHTFTVTNVGTLSAQNIVESGIAAPYAYKGGSYPGTGGDCGSTLAASAACTLVIEFSPTNTGAQNDSIYFDYDDGGTPLTSERQITGTGLPAPPEAITNLTVTSTKTTEIDIAWTAPFDNYTAISDYIIEYKESSSGVWLPFSDGTSAVTNSTVTGLTASTSYDFRVIAYNGMNSLNSNVATGETAPDVPFFDPSAFKAMNIGGATQSQVVAFEDGTTVNLNGSFLVNLDAGDTHLFTSAQNQILDADKPFFVAGRRGGSGVTDRQKGNMVWATPDWAGKEFIFTASRYAPHLVTVYAFEATTINVYQGASAIDTQAVAAESAHTFSINAYGGFKIISTGLIVAHMHSSGSSSVADPKPLLPASNDILGFPSNSVRVTALNDSTNYSLFHSNSVTSLNQGPLNAGQEISIGPQGTGSYYQSESLRIQATDKVIGNSHADSNGYCSAPFVPVVMLKKRYAVNVATEWVAFASLQGGTITVYPPGGGSSTVDLVKSGTEPDAPYKARLGGVAAGTRFESSVKFQAWYEPSSDSGGADNDETIMFGAD